MLQPLFTKQERIADIDGYHRQVDSLITEFTGKSLSGHPPMTLITYEATAVLSYQYQAMAVDNGGGVGDRPADAEQQATKP